MSYILIFGVEFTTGCVFYWILFWKLFSKCEEIGKTPDDCMTTSSKTLSTIHSILMLTSFFDFFYYQRWESPLIDEPGLSGHIWSIASSYFVADTIAHLLCFVSYSKSIIPRKWDKIYHHLLAILWWFICQWPTFKNGWSFFSPIYAAEISTIFLNLYWFGKNGIYKHKKLEKIFQMLFVILWFLVRVPIMIYSLKWLFNNWNTMKDNPEFPKRAMVYIVITLFLMMPLQLIWTAMIVRKIMQKMGHNKGNGKVSKLLDASMGSIKES